MNDTTKLFRDNVARLAAVHDQRNAALCTHIGELLKTQEGYAQAISALELFNQMTEDENETLSCCASLAMLKLSEILVTCNQRLLEGDEV